MGKIKLGGKARVQLVGKRAKRESKRAVSGENRVRRESKTAVSG